MLTLKDRDVTLYHTMRMLVMMKVPRLPVSLDRFQTPLTRLYAVSRGSSLSSLPASNAPDETSVSATELLMSEGEYGVLSCCTYMLSVHRIGFRPQ